ncbi:MAG TPA: 4'-phosphopantetheinyl transferase superfamily protein [Pyrinomonadaceae bacterium]|nr:4'-phosphopantetheinyl transferase superfamily protein [Pyrinomonadaceae bacterium]
MSVLNEIVTRIWPANLSRGKTDLRSIEENSESVDVWSFFAESSPERIAGFLPDLAEDERERSARFVFDEDRNRFIYCRWALRSILSKYMGAVPGKLRFSVNEFGKPFLNGNANGLEFSLSHSRDAALIAVTRGRRVGVDIEYVDPKTDVTALAGSVFSKSELDGIGRPALESNLGSFFSAWTRKESLLKAIGMGFSAPAGVLRELNELPKEGTVFFDMALDGRRCEWVTASLIAPEGFVAALSFENNFNGFGY